MQKNKNILQLLRKVFGLLQKKQKWGFVLVLLILAVSAVLNQFTPLAIGQLTDHILDQPGFSFGSILPFLLFILVVNVGNQLIQIVRRLIVEDTATRAEKTAREKAVHSLLSAPLSYFRQNMTGNIHGRLNRSLDGITKLVKLVFMDFAPSIATSIAAIVVIFSQLPTSIALLIVLVIPVGGLIVLRQISTQKGIRVQLLQTKSNMDGTMVELLNGIETIRVYDSVDFECQRFSSQSERLRAREMKHHRAMALYDGLKFLNEAVFHVLVIGASVLLASQGVISVGTILTAYLCFTQLTGPLRELHRILDELAENTVLANEYFRLVEIPQDFSYLPVSESTQVPSCNAIEIQGLSFSYPENPDRIILNDLSLSIRPGEFVGIAGPSGCGKSSLIKVLTKLEQASGFLTVGGKPLSDFTRSQLADLISVVPQSPFLISDTIYHNICYGCKRQVALEEVIYAARQAHIHEDIEKLPGGYSFEVSEAGGNLSGGQRQRIAIARIFLQNPQILILDEATSALDNTSEKYIQAEIEKMQRQNGTTILSIAHRLTTLQNCDRILVFDQGQIVQQGKYQQLIDQPGIFQDMYKGILK
ncbi:ABC transporter ATP-binding protein/permease [[Clostridium] leptum]|nr:ABC transporter ATP-binding protein/permease [[Clostridium] leptum]